jgi:ribosomal-protein-alanine N-acetyltransferase
MVPVSIQAARTLVNFHNAAYVLFCSHRHNPWQYKTFAKALQMPNSVIAVVNNELAGYVLVSELVGEIEIEDICVLPAFRNEGIASKMLCHIIEQAEKNGTDYIFLEVASCNSEARALYEKTGFEIISVRKQYYSLANNKFDDAILMRRSIVSKKS